MHGTSSNPRTGKMMIRPYSSRIILCITIVLLLAMVGPVFAAVPTVTGISPTSGPAAGGSGVIVTGTGFINTTAVNFGATAGTGLTVNSDNQIIITSPAHAAGVVDITVTTPAGTSATSVNDQFGYAPTVAAAAPTIGPVAGGTSVIITGIGFTGVTAVTFDVTPATSFTVNSDTQITATSPAHAAGAIIVTVTGPAGSDIFSFTYDPVPTVTSIAPASGPVAGGTTVIITGSGYTDATAVSFAGTSATSFTINSDTQITATSPAHAAGTGDVTVTSPGGTSVTSVADQFTYFAITTVTSISPTTGLVAGGNTVTVTGTGFTGATAVNFGSTPGTGLTVNSDTQITITSPAHAVGTVDVSVVTPGGTSAISVADQFTYTAVPTVTIVAPTTGRVAGGDIVTVTGTAFTGATAVNFGSTPGTGLTVVSPTQITITSPAHATGIVDVTVTTASGTSAISAADQFGYAPSVVSPAPNAGSVTGGTTVIITGTGFTGVTAVAFDVTPATSFTINSDTQITAISPAHAAGAIVVTVTGPGGSDIFSFTYYAVPTVTGILPTTGPAAGGTTVIITGSAFTGSTAVNFGATAGTGLTVNSDTQITITSPAQAAGIVDVTVTTPGGTSTTSAADQFTYTAAPAAPTVSGISPTTGLITGGTTVTVTGFGFTGATAVNFGATAGTGLTVNSDTQITITSPAHAAGVIDLTVVTPAGTSATSANDQFTYTAAPVTPTVTVVSPTSGPAAGGSTVIITGAGFTGATAVNFGATAGTGLTVNSDTQITITSPAHAAGVVDITITTPAGTSATSVNDRFGYAPAVSTAAPNTGPVAGGTTVIITGTGFTGVTAVTFGVTSATSFTVNSDTQITALSPAHAAGAIVATITGPGGSDVFAFTYTAAPIPPTVTGISPTTGLLAGGTTVTITGAGLTGATAVNFGSTAGTSFTVNSDTQITALSPAHAAGVVDVTVTTPVATSATSTADQFTYTTVTTPTITGISPTSGVVAGGTIVTVNGTGFTGATAVNFGTTPGTGLAVNSGTQITVTSPAHTAGIIDITVTTSAGTSAISAADQFTYTTTTAPTVTGISPTTGHVTGGTAVTVTGAGFTGATAVNFGTTPGTSLNVVSSTQITIVSPVHAAGIVNVTVTTPLGTSATSVNDQFGYAPSVVSAAPNTGPVAGGTTIIITGTGFTGVSAVTFGVTPATSFTVNSDTQITAVSPAHAAGAVVVTVTGPGGSDVFAFTYPTPVTPTLVSTVGIYRNGVYYLRNSNTVGNADLTFAYGSPGDTPVTGDWNGDGITTIGIYRNGVYYLRNSNTAGFADLTFAYGSPGDTPVTGRWVN